MPTGFASLLEDSVIERGVMRSVAKQRAEELREERQEAKAHLEKFRDTYGMEFESFEEQVIDTDSGREDVEAYNEWSFWRSVYERNGELLDRVENVT